MTTVTFATQHFAEGRFRYAYQGEYTAPPHKRGKECVIKKMKESYTWKPTDWNETLQILETSKQLAVGFNKYSKTNMPVKFVDVEVSQVIKVGDNTRCRLQEYITLEEYIPGDYTKWCNNNGTIDNRELLMSAFVHWSWAHSKGETMIADLQGVRNDNAHTPTNVHPGGLFPSTYVQPSVAYGSTNVHPGSLFPSTNVHPGSLFPSTNVQPSVAYGPTNVHTGGLFPSTNVQPSVAYGPTNVHTGGLFSSTNVQPSVAYGPTNVHTGGLFPSTNVYPTPSGLFPSTNVPLYTPTNVAYTPTNVAYAPTYVPVNSSYILTDPCLLSATHGGEYESTDMGIEGMANFFLNHTCNYICESLPNPRVDLVQQLLHNTEENGQTIFTWKLRNDLILIFREIARTATV